MSLLNGVGIDGIIKSPSLVVIENYESTATAGGGNTTNPGIAGSEFRIKLDEDWFKPGDVIAPDKKYLCRTKRTYC